MSQCTAKSKRSGERCKKDAVIGMGVCHIHGGKSLVGTDNPAFKLRFRTNAKGVHSLTGKRKRSYVDDVRILGQ